MFAKRARAGWHNILCGASARQNRRDAGAVERGGLENRCAFTGAGGSNPSLSASILAN